MRRVGVRVALATGVVTAGVAGLQLRTGIVPIFDTPSYWSGVRAVADGHPFTTTLSPSFSGFDAADVLGRDGRVPFVDFPLGYVTIAGLLAVVLGADAAMIALTVASWAAVGALVVIGVHSPRTLAAALVRAGGALGVSVWAISRLTTQATLSEPLFCALLLGTVVATGRYRQGRCRWWVVALLAASLGLVRFIGAPVALLAVYAKMRHDRRPRAVLTWAPALLAPTVANIVWAAAAGGGHAAGWRGVGTDDMRTLVRSIGGWVDAGHGDIGGTYFSGAPVSWWAWPFALAVLVLCVACLVRVVRDRPSPPWAVSVELPLAAVALLVAAVVLGMAGFDALVRPDNRLLLPMGLLAVCAAVWWVSDWPRARTLIVAPVLVGWLLVSAHPWEASDLFDNDDPTAPFVAAAADSGARIVVSNGADGVHWETGLPALYLPRAVDELSGEPVDVDTAIRDMVCPLFEADGVISVADDALLGTPGGDVLDALVAEGRLVAEPFDGGVLYRASPSACG